VAAATPPWRIAQPPCSGWLEELGHNGRLGRERGEIALPLWRVQRTTMALVRRECGFNCLRLGCHLKRQLCCPPHVGIHAPTVTIRLSLLCACWGGRGSLACAGSLKYGEATCRQLPQFAATGFHSYREASNVYSGARWMRSVGRPFEDASPRAFLTAWCEALAPETLAARAFPGRARLCAGWGKCASVRPLAKLLGSLTDAMLC